jgi:hypothetical protein
MSHGQSTSNNGNPTREYNSWKQMIARCYRHSASAYYKYGARGIKVCHRWRTDSTAFLRDMGPRPQAMTLDRIDNNAGYDCGNCADCRSRGVLKTNCRWATLRTQANNTRRNVFVTIDKETHTITEWLRIYGLKEATYKKRRYRYNWSILDAITVPIISPQEAGRRARTSEQLAGFPARRKTA